MMYQIQLTKQAKRKLNSLKRSDQIEIAEILEDIKDYPQIGKQLKRELTGRYSYRIGVYRVIYIINQEKKFIIILRVEHRRLVYLRGKS